MKNSTPLRIERLTARRMDDLGFVLAGSWGRSCWCMHPRWTSREASEPSEHGSESEKRRAAMTALARKRRAPGLLAYEGNEVAGWVAIAPREELHRVAASRATPPVDDLEVWVIPCITVRKGYRGRGVGVTMIQAAAEYAFEQGAAAVEAYPRADDARTSDDNAYYGTRRIFQKAGFRLVRAPLSTVPANWTPRVAMRLLAP